MEFYGVTIQLKPLQQYFHMVLFIQYVVLTLKSVDEILWCYHSSETSSAVLSHGTIYAVCSSNFWVCGWNPMVLPFKWNLFSSTFIWCYLSSSSITPCEGFRNLGKFCLWNPESSGEVQTFESVDEILWCDHSSSTSREPQIKGLIVGWLISSVIMYVLLYLFMLRMTDWSYF